MVNKEEKITCRHCGSLDVIKKGERKLSFGKRRIYFCKDCSKRFSIGLNKKQFDAWLIVDAVCLYNKGYSYEEVSELIARKHKIRVGKSSVERWAKEYGLGFLDIRDRIISKYGKEIIIERMFNHSGLVYNFKFHKGKLNEFGKFFGLKDFIYQLSRGIDDSLFNDNENRCSQSRENITVNVSCSENLRLNKIIGEMLKIVRSNYQRHSLVEQLMLCCDRDTVAVEVPVWYWNKRTDSGVCGHIDILQVKFGKIWILDYKPDAEKEKFEKVVSQLYHYAIALSFRSGMGLRDIKCGWFDGSKIFCFEPSEVRVKW
ncbi:MAG: hypothetical protein NT076_04625 [Candidatus Pacearchaeota archaeon]|nr:hypothetical protein [Candidatus Pacearchaeota archaeon]